MKRILIITGMWVVVFFVGSSFSLRENPQDPPRGKKSEKHIRMVKTDENGNKVELDTILQGDQVFVWQGDTIGGEMEWNWTLKDGPQGEHNMEMWHDKNGERRMVVSGIPAPPVPPRVGFLGRQSQNVIDLGDDNVISYKKKKLSGGREKITVIRNEPNEKHADIMVFDDEEIIPMEKGEGLVKIIRKDGNRMVIKENKKEVEAEAEQEKEENSRENN